MSEKSEIKIRPHRVNGQMVDQTMLLPSEADIAAQLHLVPPGTTRGLDEVRTRLAHEHGAEATCPVTTQRMIKVVAARAVADHAAGKPAVPYWRVVDPDKPSTEKLPGGRDFVLARRREES